MEEFKCQLYPQLSISKYKQYMWGFVNKSRDIMVHPFWLRFYEINHLMKELPGGYENNPIKDDEFNDTMKLSTLKSYKLQLVLHGVNS